ncbi:WhiB family transcriptional regulator [Gordonia alkanivorans]|nr:WhiB family transcriptional regulator [Gordonia alkanivorans]
MDRRSDRNTIDDKKQAVGSSSVIPGSNLLNRNRNVSEMLADLPKPPAWHELGICRQFDPEIFYPSHYGPTQTADAKKVCAGCDVRAVCLQWALDNNDQHGVLGGTTPRESESHGQGGCGMTCQCGRPAHARGRCARCYAQLRARQTAYGRWEPSYTDAQPVREHLLALRAAGIGNRKVRELTVIAPSTIQAILYGRPARGNPPARKVLRNTAARVLAIPVPVSKVPCLRGGRVVPALGSVRRLQALAANGYSQRELWSRLGWPSPQNATQMFAGRVENITVVRAQQVTVLFSQLQMVPGTDRNARARAKAKGWLPPLAWDEDRIDDPTYTPELVDKPRTAEDVFSDFEYLLSMGVGVEDASRRVGLLPASVKRRYERHGRRCPAALTAVARQQRKTAS